LMDIYNNDFSEYKNIHSNEHNKFYFKRYLGAFYNYFFNEYKPFLIEVNEFLFTINAIIKIYEKQRLLNLVMETYSIILKNLEKYENAMDIS
nr:hypothetical protein [Bacteroidales bacterium]